MRIGIAVAPRECFLKEDAHSLLSNFIEKSGAVVAVVAARRRPFAVDFHSDVGHAASN